MHDAEESEGGRVHPFVDLPAESESYMRPHHENLSSTSFISHCAYEKGAPRLWV